MEAVEVAQNLHKLFAVDVCGLLSVNPYELIAMVLDKSTSMKRDAVRRASAEAHPAPHLHSDGLNVSWMRERICPARKPNEQKHR
jgi:hypothetical protein